MSRRFHVFQDDALAACDATELATRLAAGEVSSTELVQAAIDRAERSQPTLNALVTRTFDRALAAAKALSPPSAPSVAVPFAGIPTFIKDNTDVAGVPTYNGSNSTPDLPAKRSDDFVLQLEAAGLISLGKSSLSEFGLIPTCEPHRHGPTRNPWSLDHSTGGSSGGAAALVSSGVVPLAHAVDGGGSTRIPAACCGLVGMKPTRGRLATMHGTEAMPVRIVSHGVVTRSVRDHAAFYAAAEAHRPMPGAPSIGHVEGPGKKRLRVGLLTEAIRAIPIDDDTMRAVQDAGALCESLGHTVEPMSMPDWGWMEDDLLTYWRLLAFSITALGRLVVHPKLDRSRLDAYTKALGSGGLRRAFKGPGAIRRLRGFAAKYETRFAEYDVVAMPVTTHVTPPLGFLDADVPFDVLIDRVKRWASFPAGLNVAGGPAITLPLGSSAEGLPIGVQFAAPAGHERRLLELALELEAAKPWRTLQEITGD